MLNDIIAHPGKGVFLLQKKTKERKAPVPKHEFKLDFEPMAPIKIATKKRKLNELYVAQEEEKEPADVVAP